MRILLEGVSKSFGPTHVIEDLDLEVRDGEMMALLGPSGCGKTTTLLSICGIHRISAGRILFGEREVGDWPPQRRNVGVVFQNYALYPHLTVYENIAFPLRVRKESHREIDAKITGIVSILRVGELLDRRPAQLSGGQQQRVALARALVRNPDVLLMDEPLVNLDAGLRLEMRSEIRRIQRETGITAILVTHDQAEAMSMCDRIALMHEGKIQQVGAPKEMYERPVNVFVAGFLGSPPTSFCEGKIAEGRFEGGSISFDLSGSIRRAAGVSEQKATLGIRPENFQPGFGLKVEGEVAVVEPAGRETVFSVRLGDGQTLRSIQNGSPSVHPGDRVHWGIERDALLFFDERGRRIS
ncbi:MAG: ABC transporter ATP-binding protein [Nitrospinota bacterium]|jgi:inositol-phosphate transport system ATP-binding protein|nr:ABC transporter ATP-binding protein [Nitrospinota bacterium]